MLENIIINTSTNAIDYYEDDYEPEYDYTYTYTYTYTYYNKELFK
jgi:hypothetical protein